MLPSWWPWHRSTCSGCGAPTRTRRPTPGPSAAWRATSPTTRHRSPERVASLDLATVELGDWEEVVDPGGGDAEEFAACAAEVVELVAALAPRLVGR